MVVGSIISRVTVSTVVSRLGLGLRGGWLAEALSAARAYGAKVDDAAARDLVKMMAAENATAQDTRFQRMDPGGNADGSSGSWIGGIYENTAVFEDGEWKFGIQDLHHLFNASYRNGWARVGAAAIAARASAAPSGGQTTGRNVTGGGITQGLGGASPARSFASQMAPDRPIRARQYAFPEITEPAFHYKNPVSGRMPKDLLP